VWVELLERNSQQVLPKRWCLYYTVSHSTRPRHNIHFISHFDHYLIFETRGAQNPELLVYRASKLCVAVANITSMLLQSSFHYLQKYVSVYTARVDRAKQRKGSRTDAEIWVPNM